MDTQQVEDSRTDLQVAASGFKAFWDKHGNTISIAVLVFAIVVFGGRWLGGRQARLAETAWTEFSGTSTPEGYQSVARKFENVPGLRSLAILRAADMLLEEAVMGNAAAPGQAPEPEAAVDPEKEAKERTAKLERAADLYGKVVTWGKPELHTLNARFGLAAVFESMQDFDAAREQYQAVMDKATAFEMLKTVAEKRLADVDRLSKPVVFAEPAPPAPEMPAIGGGAPSLAPDLSNFIKVPDEPAGKPATTEADSNESNTPAEATTPEPATEEQPGEAAAPATDSPETTEPATEPAATPDQPEAPAEPASTDDAATTQEPAPATEDTTPAPATE